MIRIFYCLMIALFFFSCSAPEPEYDDPQNNTWDTNNNSGGGNGSGSGGSGQSKEGFQKHENHLYGFDAISNSKIVHISIPKNESGYVTVLTDTAFIYYYCDEHTNPLYDLDYIDEKKQKHTLEITSSSPNKINLCKEDVGGVFATLVQELHIHRYDWKSYDFYIYNFGGDMRYQAVEKNDFWTGFDTVYNQAIVESGYLSRNYGNVPSYFRQRKYILSRARGNYEASCAKSDIDKAINEIEFEAQIEKKAIIQLDHPTKRFWPLKINAYNGYSIEICGKPSYNEDPTKPQSPPIYLELELLPDTPYHLDCNYNIVSGTQVIWYENAWYLKYGADDIELATIDNAHPECAVFVEKNIHSLEKQYVGEIPIDRNGRQAAAVMKRELDRKVATIILPWQNTEAETKRVAYHELGHAMGLDDVEGSNLMSYSANTTSSLLQGRLLRSISGKQESQWECLQENNINFNCADPHSIYRGY